MPHVALGDGKFLQGNHCFSRLKDAQIHQTLYPECSVWATEMQDLRGPPRVGRWASQWGWVCTENQGRRVFQELGVRWRWRLDPRSSVSSWESHRSSSTILLLHNGEHQSREVRVQPQASHESSPAQGEERRLPGSEYHSLPWRHSVLCEPSEQQSKTDWC